MDKQIKILIVDDSVFMRNVLKNILTNAGYSYYVEGSNGNEALKLAEAEKPDLILLDLIMPEMGGIDVLKKIGGKERIIIISAVGQDSMVDEAKQYGAKSYIIKPFDINQVVDTVTAVMSKAGAKEEKSEEAEN